MSSNTKRTTQIQVPCPVCRTVVTRTPCFSHIKTCSRKCGEIFSHNKYVEANQRACKVCGKLFVPKHNKSKGLFCSYACSGKNRIQSFIMRNGYRFVRAENHPNCTKQGYYAEHRLVMESHIGRYLDKKEVVHHINHIKSDNSIGNLMLFPSPGQHTVSCHKPTWENGRWHGSN
jgi:endogenous inhibitor of DNA gyrase (YacG/DUF329 family)